MAKKSKVLITGINGFIGRNLSDYIRERYPEFEVYGIDKKGNGDRKFCRLDISNEAKLRNFLLKLKPRYIFHFTGESSSADFEALLLSNFFSTFSLFKIIRGIDKYNPRVVIPSSASEYGAAPSCRKVITKEDRSPEPVSLYGFSKMIQTNLSLFFARQGSDVVVARIFNIIGKGVPVSFSIGKFAYELALIKKKQKFPQLRTKGLDSKRDFLDIKDICAYLIVLAINGSKGEIYNVCRGRSYSIRSLLKKIINISGVENVKIKEESNRDNERSVGDSFGSAKKIRRIVKGFKLTPINRSLELTYQYYLKRV